jgi:hypothetical protein
MDTHVDVTEQYEAKAELQRAFDEIKRSEDRLRLVIDTIPTLVWRAYQPLVGSGRNWLAQRFSP